MSIQEGIIKLLQYCCASMYKTHTGEMDFGVTTTTWENESSLSQSRWTTCHHHSNTSQSPYQM